MNEKIKEILLKRGFTNDEEINKFLFPNFENLKNPFSLTGMVEAVNILKKNIENKKKILIFGDYDVDGVTSTALLFLGLKELGCKNVYYTVANRFNEGYGIGMKTISKAIEDKISLLITVDCGTKDFETWARIVGYCIPINNYNKVRRKEYGDRIFYGAGEVEKVSEKERSLQLIS